MSGFEQEGGRGNSSFSVSESSDSERLARVNVENRGFSRSEATFDSSRVHKLEINCPAAVFSVCGRWNDVALAIVSQSREHFANKEPVPHLLSDL